MRDADPAARQRRVLRVLVVMQLAVVALVVVGYVAIWLLGRFGDLYGSR